MSVNELSINQEYFRSLWQLATRGQSNELREAIQGFEYDIDHPINPFGWTFLHAAIYFGDLALVKFLIEEKLANPSVVPKNEMNCLMLALMKEKHDVI